jgi:hypothetical protein
MAASTPDDTTKADDDRSAARWGARKAEATEAAEDGDTAVYAVVGTDRLVVPIEGGDPVEVLRTGSPVPAELLDAVKAGAKAARVKLRKVRG